MTHHKNLAFFIGAGFTKAIINAAPDGNEFFLKAFTALPSLVSDRKIQNCEKFVKDIYHISDANYPRIEDVLSLMDFLVQENENLSSMYPWEKIESLRNDFIYLIGKVIEETLAASQVQNLSVNFVEKVFKETDFNLSIISANYDILLDNALLRNGKNCNYGERVRASLKWPPGGESSHFRPSGIFDYWMDNNNGSDKLNYGKIPLLKLHGSLNWFYCPKCKELDITVEEKSAVKLFGQSDKTYLCLSKMCTSRYEPLLVTPTMLKVYDNEFLKTIWSHAEVAISNADKLVFIGYSLPEADYHIRILLIKSIAKGIKIPEILIITKPPKNKNDERDNKLLEDRYRALFGSTALFFEPIGLKGLLDNWQKHFPRNI